MQALEKIKQAIRQLALIERESIATWLSDDISDHDSIAEPAAAYGANRAMRLLTVDEYLEFEETANVRHEYVAGLLYAMTGPRKSHGRISTNLVAAFHSHLRGGPCQTYASQIKLRLKAGQNDIFYYPDLMVVCGPETASEVYVEQPKLIVEILSPSTETIDRREKALNYRNIAAVEEYILISQKRPQIEIHRRADNWQPTALTSLDATADFHSIALSLPLSQIYEGVHSTRAPAPT
ncbi:MAG: Uma2 family endonuclease [Proteobacteria bacterium]|nr:Uma2 family endonuclease [Pseudomonadota bacterium]